MRIDMDHDPDAAVERGEYLHQPVQREPTKTRGANARKVRMRIAEVAKDVPATLDQF